MDIPKSNKAKGYIKIRLFVHLKGAFLMQTYEMKVN